MKKIILLSFISIALVSCNKTGWNIKPSGEVITDTIQITSFKTLLNNSSANIELDNSINPKELVVVGDRNFVENLYISNKGNDLNIENKSNTSFNTTSSPLVIKLNNKLLEKVMIAGSGSIKTNNTSIKNDIEFHISGAGAIDVELFNNSTSVFVSGAGDIKLKGSTSALKAIMSGAGNLNAEKLQNKTATIEISGAGNGKVNTSEELNVKISGIGNLNYKTYNDLKVNQKISGIGSIDAY